MDKKVKQKCVSWMLRSTGTIVSEICLNLIGSDRITFKVSWVVAMSIPLLRYNVWSCFHGIHQHRHGCVLTVLGSFHMNSHSPGPCSLLIHLNHLICVVTYHMLLYLFVSRFICSVLICHIKKLCKCKCKSDHIDICFISHIFTISIKKHKYIKYKEIFQNISIYLKILILSNYVYTV